MSRGLHKSAADGYMSAATVVFFILCSTTSWYSTMDDYASCTPLELIYKPFFSDLRVSHLLP